MSRIASLIPRLTPPKIVTGERLPRFNEICQSHAQPQPHPSPPQPQPPTEATAEQDQPKQFSELLKRHPFSASDDEQTKSIDEICQTATENHRLIFIGEQHHQPKVLAAQLQLLHRILSNQSKKQIHVVFEQWSLADQPQLHRINKSASDDQVHTLLYKQTSNAVQQSQAEEVTTTKTTTTSEGFQLDHYGVLIQLVRQLGGSVWGGFPPRSWARLVARGTSDRTNDQVIAEPKSALQLVQQLDQERFEKSVKQIQDLSINGSTVDQDVNLQPIPPMPLANYELVKNVSWPHRTYLKSMFAPDKRPCIPSEAQQPSPPKPEQVGFTAAQALKDSIFAHVISTLLKRDPNCLVVAICGLGHCEWGFGAPERVSQFQSTNNKAQSTTLTPYTIITKPNDSPFWPALKQSFSSSDATMKDEQWQRKQADAILLYDWVD